MRLLQLIIFLLAIALTGGCSTTIKDQPSQEIIYQTGRISITTPGNPPVAWHAAYTLTGNPKQGHLDFVNPLGGVLAALDWSNNTAQLQANNESHTAPSLDGLLQKFLQTPPPAENLLDWLHGIPQPTAGWNIDTTHLSRNLLIAEQDATAPQATKIKIILDR